MMQHQQPLISYLRLNLIFNISQLHGECVGTVRKTPYNLQQPLANQVFCRLLVSVTAVTIV